METIEFDDHEYAATLIQEKVDVQFVDGGEEWAHWGFRWRHGGIGFTTRDKPEEEEKARKAAALFVYLWSKGVGAHLAEKCAEAYVNTWVVRLIGPEESRMIKDKMKKAIDPGNVRGGLFEDGK